MEMRQLRQSWESIIRSPRVIEALCHIIKRASSVGGDVVGSRGERLRPLTLTRPKMLIEVGGKPLLSHVLEALKAIGISRMVLVVSYMEDAIRSWLGDGSALGLEVANYYTMLSWG